LHIFKQCAIEKNMTIRQSIINLMVREDTNRGVIKWFVKTRIMA